MKDRGLSMGMKIGVRGEENMEKIGGIEIIRRRRQVCFSFVCMCRFVTVCFITPKSWLNV